MIATTVVSYFYYFEFIRQMYFVLARGRLAIPGRRRRLSWWPSWHDRSDFLAKRPSVPRRNPGTAPLSRRDCFSEEKPRPLAGFFTTVRTKCFAFFTAIGHDGVERVAKGAYHGWCVSLGLVD